MYVYIYIYMNRYFYDVFTFVLISNCIHMCGMWQICIYIYIYNIYIYTHLCVLCIFVVMKSPL